MSEQEMDMMALLQKMQQQLVFLEKKLDTLLQQSQQKPSFGGNRERSFSKPFRPFTRPGGHRPDGHGPSFGHGPNRGPVRHDRGDRPREGNFAPKKKFFGGHQGGGNHHRNG